MTRTWFVRVSKIASLAGAVLLIGFFLGWNSKEKLLTQTVALRISDEQCDMGTTKGEEISGSENEVKELFSSCAGFLE